MFWAQALLSFALWVAFGVVRMRNSTHWRDRAKQVSPAKRGIQAAAAFLLAVVVLFGPLTLIATLGGLTKSGFTLWAWLVLTAAGLAFVALQTWGTALLVLSAQDSVTQARLNTSGKPESIGTSSDEDAPR